MRSLAGIIHEASTARLDQADLTDVLGLRTLRPGVQPRLGSEALRAPVISVCCTRSLRTFMNNADQGLGAFVPFLYCMIVSL